MSLTSALNSAMSGLAAASRASQIVSDNIANAMTPGFGRRSLELSSDARIGSGVRITGLQRHSDPALTASRRDADAKLAMADTDRAFVQQLETLIGAAAGDGNLMARYSAFEQSLISAASAPESPIRLDAVAMRAKDLATAISDAAKGVQALRSDADRDIAVLVDRMNEGLAQIEDINARITAAGRGGETVASLADQRQALIDELNRIVPVNVVDRPGGQVALYSDDGAILLDGSAVEIGYTPATMVTAGMTAETGMLSGLDLNGLVLRPGALGGGSLGAQFQIRDAQAPAVQDLLDRLAGDLIDRFETSGLDPTVTDDQPGLFTDAGNALDQSALVGIAARLQVNAVVDPDRGGDSWHLRDGLGAAAPGYSGDASTLLAFSRVLTESRPSDSGYVTAADLSRAVVADIGGRTATAEEALSYATVSQSELTRLEAEQGVDTDAELQNLMIVEKAYAANARIVQAVETMMDTLLRI